DRTAPRRERGRTVAHRHSIQCGERTPRSERTRCGPDHRVHRNPATLVTPTIRYPALNISHDHQTPGHIDNRPNGTRKERKNDDNTQDGNTRTVADSAARVARGGEGTHAARRRTGAAAAGTAQGSDP